MVSNSPRVILQYLTEKCNNNPEYYISSLTFLIILLSIFCAKQYNVYGRDGMMMDFLVVSDSKLKIMMSLDEMKKYGIDGDNIDYDNPKTRRAFWKILDAAKESCGFEVSGDKVLIQFYPAKDGSEIFVTKLGLISAGAERAISKSSKVAMLTTKRTVYKFNSLSAICACARAVEKEQYESAPRAYIDEYGGYYLITDERKSTSPKFPDMSLIHEFGEEIPSNLAPYIAEHSEELSFDTLRKA